MVENFVDEKKVDLQQTTSLDSPKHIQDEIESNESHQTLDEHVIDDNASSLNQKVYHSRGVQRAENVKVLMDTSKQGKWFRISLALSLLICAWVYSLDRSTTSSYSPYATSSFGHHSMISTLKIATSIMSSVSQPMLAKFSDVTSRPITYILVLVLYMMGYIIVAASKTISAYVIGEVFVTIGGTGITLMNSIIAADLTPLKYRGLLFGILVSPYLITTWFAGLIVEAILGKGNWRWGYGMFAIIMPVAISPTIFIMIWLDNKAAKLAEENIKIKASETLEKPKTFHFRELSTNQKFQFLWQQSLEIDLFGLILMGFGWSLLLLPFSLYQGAENQWKNPSIIAMIAVGAILLILYTIYEFWFAPFPSMPKRVLLNRTFMTAVFIDFFYMFAGYIKMLYFSSYVWVIKEYSYQNWTYFNNTLTMSLCFFGVVVGVIQRYTHRTKYLQVFGLTIQLISMGITLWARNDHASTGALVWTEILLGIGGACSSVGSQVASQASVPHQDTALVISLLLQWSSIGGAIGSAVSSAIWQGKMPGNLRKFMPSSVSDEEVLTLFGSITSIRTYAYDSPERQGAIKAYFDTAYYLFIVSLVVTAIPFIASLFQKNFYLGDTQNAVEFKLSEQKRRDDGKPKPFWRKITDFLDEPFQKS
ncbi:Siderophore iron transporter [Wickerhamomyces ciferrii]|uniref:Siderophore iron transporter n=1 Tax=Wickerhamomyces ciferrii (strain ATCC 14091 / BCRC 22168 / CBS 111 / JCM 3599 / NBRC 0793 / NRRL Y-1031 F-60-10) TaxID=1206466 RepID=K0KY73_WICCF|nr:Siderophore iron transporter [Wickerhamomyces ciferrii]CCH46048.1 Siderophore iron transporter [Wickerhamomyces ciferrii]